MMMDGRTDGRTRTDASERIFEDRLVQYKTVSKIAYT